MKRSGDAQRGEPLAAQVEGISILDAAGDKGWQPCKMDEPRGGNPRACDTHS